MQWLKVDEIPVLSAVHCLVGVVLKDLLLKRQDRDGV